MSIKIEECLDKSLSNSVIGFLLRSRERHLGHDSYNEALEYKKMECFLGLL